jgi:hypothetical protein
MSHRINAAMQPMQPPRADRAMDSGFIKPRLTELRSGDHPVLPPRDRRNSRPGRGDFLSHGDRKAPRPSISPPKAGNRWLGTARRVDRAATGVVPEPRPAVARGPMKWRRRSHLRPAEFSAQDEVARRSEGLGVAVDPQIAIFLSVFGDEMDSPTDAVLEHLGRPGPRQASNLTPFPPPVSTAQQLSA